MRLLAAIFIVLGVLLIVWCLLPVGAVIWKARPGRLYRISFGPFTELYLHFLHAPFQMVSMPIGAFYIGLALLLGGIVMWMVAGCSC